MAEHSFAAAIAQSTFNRRIAIGSLIVAMTGIIVAIVAIVAIVVAILIAQ